MKYYKKLDLPGWEIVSQKTYNLLEKYEEKFLGTEDRRAIIYLDKIHYLRLVPEVLTIFKPYNLTIKTISAIRAISHDNLLHIDKLCESTYRINFPIKNCDNTYTKFYRVKDPSNSGWTHSNYPLTLFKDEDCVFEDEVTVDRPTMLNVRAPHKIVIGSDIFPRITVSFKFNEDISFLMD